MGGIILKTIKIDCYERNFKDTEMSLFNKEFPVVEEYLNYEIHVIDTGETYKYRLSDDNMYLITE